MAKDELWTVYRVGIIGLYRSMMMVLYQQQQQQQKGKERASGEIARRPRISQTNNKCDIIGSRHVTSHHSSQLSSMGVTWVATINRESFFRI